jgi:hypothetical protein
MGITESSDEVNPVVPTCASSAVALGYLKKIPSPGDFEKWVEENDEEKGVSPFDAVMPHVIALLQSICTDSVTRRKVQRQLKKSCLLK